MTDRIIMDEIFYLVGTVEEMSSSNMQFAIAMGCGLNADDGTYKWFAEILHPTDNMLMALQVPDYQKQLLEEDQYLLLTRQTMVDNGWFE